MKSVINKPVLTENFDDDDCPSPPDGASSTHSSKMQPTREVLINYSGYPELDSDIGPSELSDIAEEPEEGLTSDDGGSSRGSTPKIVTNNSNSIVGSSSIISNATSSTSLTRWSNSSLYQQQQQKQPGFEPRTSQPGFEPRTSQV